ncbi:serine palmitoyltransferase [Laccaria bicolor S238N-H82]|uniref:serine C-palmitoyltransferase n=1 Tax=Laccaria bicolor (strain S238N-H82 / ATCC MYA-4686) TaxID=486041 RepID=B0D7J5_LACBS|nr:serine palmitoyltransferase [Laccaria bicolor S238N-H82]EDR09408.1 serine palmitoyltransferase [Laccaria bicolor S238N-H82]|eukprot:XP_001879757.1 serine palmitoyltransferase [Laccaria bicolor S238N-H82]
MEGASATLEPLFAFLAHALATAETTFNRLPGSAVIQRYVKSSHQNDPGRTILELILVVFAIRTLLQSRTRADRNGKHFIQFSDKEIDELVDEWSPEPLAQPLTAIEQADLAAVPIVAGPNGPKPKLVATGKTATNLTSFNFTGLAGNEHIKQKAVETLRKYGLGSCGPPGFYGTLDVHIDLERDIADFLGTEAAILYSQGFSTISSVIPAFCKRGDIIVADRGVNFAIQKGIQISRSTVRWFDHNDLNSLEDVLIGVEKERKKRRGPLTRRFIITEGIFERDGVMVDLPKLIELKYKYKYRLILDESFSFGTVGRTGRGLTELYNVPATKVDMLLGSVAIGLCSSGGFCAGSQNVVDHQRINGPSFVFSASMPALLAVSASEGINILRSTPSILTSLQENVQAAHAILDRVDCITIPSHPASPVIHIQDSASQDWDIDVEERLLQDVVDEALAQGVILSRAKRLRGQEMVDVRPSIRLALTSALTKKETEKAVGIVKATLVKVLGKRR